MLNLYQMVGEACLFKQIKREKDKHTVSFSSINTAHYIGSTLPFQLDLTSIEETNNNIAILQVPLGTTSLAPTMMWYCVCMYLGSQRSLYYVWKENKHWKRLVIIDKSFSQLSPPCCLPKSFKRNGE